MQHEIGVKGTMTAVLTSKGKVTTTERSNMILNTGFELISKALMGTTDAITEIAVGSGTTPTEESQTALLTAISTKSCTSAYNATTKSITFTATFGSDVVGAITEAGLVSASGKYLDRSVFPVLNKGADDDLVINFVISFSEV